MNVTINEIVKTIYNELVKKSQAADNISFVGKTDCNAEIKDIEDK